MYGLEKQPKAVFKMDLEIELEKHPQKAQEYLKGVQTKIQEIKSQLREGAKGPEFEQLGNLLHGYNALQKVLTKLGNKK